MTEKFANRSYRSVYLLHELRSKICKTIKQLKAEASGLVSITKQAIEK